ncbi:phage major capsid protein [Paraburkholderia sp. BR14263]|uniref:phage major capsid protein n=1 Tax=unclassified Paraburkholderia TaxID=2615204 RepID=UPI0034CF7ABF
MHTSEIARAVAALVRCKGDKTTAVKVAVAQWGEQSKAAALLRQAIDTGSIGDEASFAELIAAVPSRSIIRAVDTISPFRAARPGMPVLVTSTPPEATWRAEAQPIDVASAEFEIVRLGADHSIAGIILFTREAASELGERFVRQIANDIGASINSAEGRAMFDVTNAGSASMPASILYGAPTIASTGSTGEALRADISALLDAYGGDLSRSVWVCSPSTAARLSMLGDGLQGADVHVNGGYLAGMPLCAASGVPNDVLALIDPSGIVLYDGGGQVSVADQTLVHVAAEQGDPEAISLWQKNLAATRFVRALDWQAGRTGVAAAITGISWSSTTRTAPKVK